MKFALPKFNPKVKLNLLGKVIQDNSPTILAGLAVVGVGATGYFTFKGSREAAALELKDVGYSTEVSGDDSFMWTTRTRFERTWKLYMPAVISGTLTIGCIVASNRIHARRLAALAAGYAVLSGDFDEYKQKAAEMLGAKKNAELNQKVAKDKIEQAGKPHGILTGQQSWFCDESTRRIFPSTMETIKHAQNTLNYKLNNQGDVSLNHFYEELDLEVTTLGDMLGWHPTEKIELVFTPILTEEYGAVTAFDFATGSLPKYWEAK